MTKLPTAKQKTQNFRTDLKKDKSGLNRFKTTELPKAFWTLFFQKIVHKNTSNITGRMSNNQNQNFSSN